jgi:hypothetical protein
MGSPETAADSIVSPGRVADGETSGHGGALEQALSSMPKMPGNKYGNVRSVVVQREKVLMWLLVVEALAALVILVLIVWWTMFSGRKGGELDQAEKNKDTQA